MEYQQGKEKNSGSGFNIKANLGCIDMPDLDKHMKDKQNGLKSQM